MSTVRLWDNSGRLLITESDCPRPKLINTSVLEVKVPGNTSLRGVVIEAMPNELDLNVTVDMEDGRRYSAKVTRLAVDDRPCECGSSRILSTTVEGTMLGWPD